MSERYLAAPSAMVSSTYHQTSRVQKRSLLRMACRVAWWCGVSCVACCVVVWRHLNGA